MFDRRRTPVCWTLFAALALLLGPAPRTPLQAADPPPLPAGYSTQSFGGRTFELIVPPAPGEGGRDSLLLLVSVNGRDDIAHAYDALAEDGFVVCAPKTRFLGVKGHGENWAANEGPELVELVSHLLSALPIAPDRLHVLGQNDWAGFLPMVAFAKGSHFRSVTFVEAAFRGGSLPSNAKKELGVMVYGKGPMDQVPADQRILPALSGKVRTVEYRHGEAPPNDYFRYWIGVMEGRFVPGHDLSLAWKGMAPGDDLKAMAKKEGRPCLLYFFSDEDLAKPEAKALQNEVFFEPGVREAAKPLTALLLDRAASQALFTELGLTKTPAVVLASRDLAVLARFEGRIEGKDLEKALRKAAADARD